MKQLAQDIKDFPVFGAEVLVRELVVDALPKDIGSLVKGFSRQQRGNLKKLIGNELFMLALTFLLDEIEWAEWLDKEGKLAMCAASLVVACNHLAGFAPEKRRETYRLMHDRMPEYREFHYELLETSADESSSEQFHKTMSKLYNQFCRRIGQEGSKDPFLLMSLEATVVALMASIRNFFDELQAGVSSHMEDLCVDSGVAKLLPRDVCEKHLIFPIGRKGRTLILAMVDPKNYGAIDDANFMTGLNVDTVVATEAQILGAIARYHSDDES